MAQFWELPALWAPHIPQTQNRFGLRDNGVDSVRHIKRRWAAKLLVVGTGRGSPDVGRLSDQRFSWDCEPTRTRFHWLGICWLFHHTRRCWDLKTDRCVMTLYGHSATVNCLDVHADRLVSGSKDCLVKGEQPLTISIIVHIEFNLQVWL